MKKYFPALLLLMVLIDSCKKNNGGNEPTYIETDVNGQLTDLTTGGPMVNVPISVYFEKEHNSYGPSGASLLHKVRTDASGNHALHFTRTIYSEDPNYKYYYRVSLDSIYGTRGYRLPLQFNNPINFVGRFYKNMYLHLKVMRHDRNYLIIGLKNPLVSFSGYDGTGTYQMINPTYNLDTVFNFPYVPQGLNYDLNIILVNKGLPPQYGFIDSVTFQRSFYMLNDTTINYTVL